MNIQREQLPSHAIESYQQNHIQIAGQKYDENVLVLSDQIIHPWQDGFDWQKWQQILSAEVEVLIIGNAAPQDIPMSFREQLMQRRVGMEAMNLGAACRTFNLMLAEGRAVVGYFLFNNE